MGSSLITLYVNCMKLSPLPTYCPLYTHGHHATCIYSNIKQFNIPKPDTYYLCWWHPQWTSFASCSDLRFKQPLCWYRWRCFLVYFFEHEGTHCLTVHTWASIGTINLCSLAKCLHLAADCCTGSALASSSWDNHRVKLFSYVAWVILNLQLTLYRLVWCSFTLSLF